jgi:hypothetical protein
MPTQPFFQWVTRVFPTKEKWLGCEVDRSPPFGKGKGKFVPVYSRRHISRAGAVFVLLLYYAFIA